MFGQTARVTLSTQTFLPYVIIFIEQCHRDATALLHPSAVKETHTAWITHSHLPPGYRLASW